MVSRAKLRSERAFQPILMAQRAKIRPERAKLRPPIATGGGRRDGKTDGRKDGRTEGPTSRNAPLCPTGHRPLGAAAQKGTPIYILLKRDSEHGIESHDDGI